MCCCVSAAGMALPPAFIFPRVRFASHMLRGAPAGSLGLSNPSGWMKQDVFLQVLKHFIDNMSVSKDQPGVLIMDNHNPSQQCYAGPMRAMHSIVGWGSMAKISS